MIERSRLKELIERNNTFLDKMNTSADPKAYASLAREYAALNLNTLAAKSKELLDMDESIKELKELKTDDNEIRELAREEIAQLSEKITNKEQELALLLLPRDKADDKPAILEVRAGTGGAEAALFAGDLFRMYQRYADLRGWKFETISASPSEAGGYKEAIASVSGKAAFARLKHESGTHRVQRVPETEASGRIHTSAATVAVLPQAEEIDVNIDEDKDLEIQVFRSSGPGGQSVNTTDSAVRIKHIPTGIVVTQQDEKSQHRNRAKAMRILRSRIYAAQREQSERERAAIRRDKVGSGDRSERIRTYNFPQGRVTDHRVELTLHKLSRILDGESLDEIIEALAAQEQVERLEAATQSP
ncbi:MAG: peptide chain release factor 1 [Hyphomicrobiales bacterium]|nr:peptide chain release factor 1 [Hyphomicrobiales bacterium]